MSNHTGRITDRDPERLALSCAICGQTFVGEAGILRCRRCHQDYKRAAIALHQYEAGWRQACKVHGVGVNQDALVAFLVALRKGGRSR